MNNSSVSRSNHSTRVLVSICFVILLCVVIALWFSKVNAANIVRRTVSMYLDEKQISYTSVHVNNQTLSVELQSSGEGRCTLDDVKAIQNIYTVIHAQSLADKIRNVKIEIVDRTGTVIYDETEADVSSKVENDLAQTTTADTEIIADRDILQEARNVLADTSYSIQSVNISDAEEITGKCLNLTLTLSNADDSSVSRISSVYDNLESYSLSTGAITQCNITLLNDEQECIAYMIGDFQYGNCIAWISPDYENAFVAQEGPQPDNYHIDIKQAVKSTHIEARPNEKMSW